MPITEDALTEAYAEYPSLSISNIASTLIFDKNNSGTMVERQLPVELNDWAKIGLEYKLKFPGKTKMIVRYDNNIIRQLFIKINPLKQ